MAPAWPNEARTPAPIPLDSVLDSYFGLDLFLFKTLFIGLCFKSLECAKMQSIFAFSTLLKSRLYALVGSNRVRTERELLDQL